MWVIRLIKRLLIKEHKDTTPEPVGVRISYHSPETYNHYRKRFKYIGNDIQHKHLEFVSLLQMDYIILMMKEKNFKCICHQYGYESKDISIDSIQLTKQILLVCDEVIYIHLCESGEAKNLSYLSEFVKNIDEIDDKLRKVSDVKHNHTKLSEMYNLLNEDTMKQLIDHPEDIDILYDNIKDLISKY